MSALCALACLPILATCTPDVTAPLPAVAAVFTVQPGTVTAGAAISPAIQLAVHDETGAVVTTATGSVTIAIGDNPADGVLSGTTTVNAVGGMATFSDLSIYEAAAGYTLIATSADLTGPTSDPFTVVAGAPTDMAIHGGDDQTATAGSEVETAPGVIVRDAHGNVVSGVEVTFAVTSGGGSVTGADATTDEDGIAIVGGWTLGTTAGANSLAATSEGLSGSPSTFTATGTAGPAARITVSAGAEQSATVGTAVATPPSVLVTDAHDNPVEGATVTFAVVSADPAVAASPPLAADGAITGADATTGADGIATVGSWTLGTTAGANSLTATSGELAGSPVTFTATGTSGTATQIAAQAGDDQSAVAGSAVATPPSVIVRDANNNPVAEVSVTFAVASGGGAITGADATTGADGIATVGSWTLGTTAGANSLTATSAGLTGSPVTINATGTAGAATQVAIDAGDDQVAVAGSAVTTPPSVIVKDANDNPVAEVSVTFAVASGGGAITGADATTGADGIATVGSWTLGTTAGANSLTATSDGLTGSPVTISATGTSGSGAQIAIDAGDNQVAVAGSAVATPPSVIVKDANDNPVAEVSVTFAVASGGGSITGADATTGADGIATVESWTLGTTAGANSLTATSAGLTGSPVTINATGTAGTATQIALDAGDNQSATAGSAVATPPSVIVRDINNNPVAGVGVTFAVASGGGAVTSGSATTDANGIATVGSWTLGTTAGANSLTATSAGLTGSPVTINATGTAGAATQIAVDAGDNQSATVGTAVATPPSVIARDVNNNPVAGVSVTFAVASGGGAVTGGSATTDANGIATVGSWTLGTTAGANSLTATSAGLSGSPVTINATGTAGAPTQVELVEGDDQFGKGGVALATNPSVIVRDVFDNPVSGETVTFAVATGGGSVTGAMPATDASGVATVGSWAPGPGTAVNTLTATAAGLPGSPVTFTADMFSQATTGANHACALTTLGSAYCWGRHFESLGAAPVLVGGGVSTFASIESGRHHACGLTDAGIAYCWGDNGDGRLGDGTQTSTSDAVAVSTVLTFESLAPGERHTCGIATGGTAYCWGHNDHGRLGDGTMTQSDTAVAVTGGITFASLSAGGTHTCGVTAAGVGYCWGNNGPGQLGDATNAQSSAPSAVSGGLTWSTIQAGRDHSCGLTTAGEAYCWGSGIDGQLGNGINSSSGAPVPVSGGLTFASMALGAEANTTCAVTTGGIAYCWGWNSSGEIGDGTKTLRNTPTLVSGGLTFAHVTSNHTVTCGITTAGVTHCWGNSGNGQVGAGVFQESLVPTEVLLPF